MGWLTYMYASDNMKALVNLDERVIALENQVAKLEKEIKQLKERG